MIRIRDTFKSYDEYKDFYMNSTGYDLSQDAITDNDRNGIPEYDRWQYGLKWLEDLNCETVMDIGSWTGRFPTILAVNNFVVEAVEANKAAYLYSIDNKFGIWRVLNCMLEEYDFGNGYDAITAFEVIEHAYDLDRWLEKIKNILTDDGYFIFSTPSQNGAYSNEDNDIHLWTATIESLHKTFKDWEIIDYEDGDIIKMVVRKESR